MGEIVHYKNYLTVELVYLDTSKTVPKSFSLEMYRSYINLFYMKMKPFHA